MEEVGHVQLINVVKNDIGGEGQYQCEECPAVYKSIGKLKQHRE